MSVHVNPFVWMLFFIRIPPASRSTPLRLLLGSPPSEHFWETFWKPDALQGGVRIQSVSSQVPQMLSKASRHGGFQVPFSGSVGLQAWLTRTQIDIKIDTGLKPSWHDATKGCQYWSIVVPLGRQYCKKLSHIIVLAWWQNVFEIKETSPVGGELVVSGPTLYTRLIISYKISCLIYF